MKFKKALFAGSFDPFHDGHLHILKKANELFDEVYVAVSINPNKNSSKLEKRVDQVSNFLKEHDLKNKVIKNDGLTVELAKKIGCKYLIRGLRNNLDLEYELELANLNKKIDSSIETIFLVADNEFKNISSSKLK